MQTNARRYILELNGFEGSEVSVFIQDADGEPLSAHYAIVLVDVQVFWLSVKWRSDVLR